VKERDGFFNRVVEQIKQLSIMQNNGVKFSEDGGVVRVDDTQSKLKMDHDKIMRGSFDGMDSETELTERLSNDDDNGEYVLVKEEILGTPSAQITSRS